LADAVAARRFDDVGECLSPRLVSRALLPEGVVDWDGPAPVVEHLQRWFGGDRLAEVVDDHVCEIRSRAHLSWRLRVERADGWHTIEQQAYADVNEDGRVTVLDLLCSGFLPDEPAGARRAPSLRRRRHGLCRRAGRRLPAPHLGGCAG
jgi:hypothetical protein